MSSALRIVFMGTPEFAVSSLSALVDGGFQVVGVITSPDKAAGRGQRIHESAVKKYAVEKGIHLLQPTNLKDPEFQQALRSLNADLQIVVAFRMLPEAVWAMPSKGTINLHASLLPDYRGAAPINWAVMNGDKETGLTTFFIEKEIDTGKVILQVKIDIPSDWSAGQLHDEMMILGGALIVKTVQCVEENALAATDQDKLQNGVDAPRPAPKIFKEDCKINWNLPAHEVYNHIRGLSPYPAAWSELASPDGNSSSIKIFKCAIGAGNTDGTPGTIDTDGKAAWRIYCGNGSLELQEIQLAGKKRMAVPDFLRGFDLNNNWTLT